MRHINCRGKSVWCDAEQKCRSIRQISGVQYKGRKVNEIFKDIVIHQNSKREEKIVKRKPSHFFLTKVWNVVGQSISSSSVQMRRLLGGSTDLIPRKGLGSTENGIPLSVFDPRLQGGTSPLSLIACL